MKAALVKHIAYLLQVRADLQDEFTAGEGRYVRTVNLDDNLLTSLKIEKADGMLHDVVTSIDKETLLRMYRLLIVDIEIELRGLNVEFE